MKLGIDFGTSFSFVAEWRDEDKAPQSRVRENVPTIFYYDEIHGEKIGKEAEQLMLKIPSNGVRNIKKYIIEKDLNHVFRLGEYKKVEGDEFTPGRVKEFTLREVVAKFIKTLIGNVTASKSYYYPSATNIKRGEKEKIENIAVAIPVELNIETSWTFLQKCVAEAAGIPTNKVYFIHEPVAAAMSYYVLNKNTGNRILVYDLGGGTMDAAVVAYGSEYNGSHYGVNIDEDSRYEVLAMYGERIGGNDFDGELSEYLMENIGQPNERANLKVHIKAKSEYGERFKKEVTEAKERLSQRDNISFAYERMSYKADVTSRKFEELTSDLLERTVLVTKMALQGYKERYGKNATLDAFVLSGGSSQMPMVMRRLSALREEIKNDFPDVKIIMERPDCAISFGAAIYAANLDRLTFVSPYTYGIYIFGGGNFDMIFKNEPMVKYPDGKYISAKKNYAFDTLRMRDLRVKVYERDDRYSAAKKSGTGEVQPATFGFNPAFDICVPVDAVGGEPGIHNLMIELKLMQGEPLQAHVYDNDQNGKEINLSTPAAEAGELPEPERKIERKAEIKPDIQADITLTKEDEVFEIVKDDSRHKISEKTKKKTGIIEWVRRIWRKLFSKK